MKILVFRSEVATCSVRLNIKRLVEQKKVSKNLTLVILIKLI